VNFFRKNVNTNEPVGWRLLLPSFKVILVEELVEAVLEEVNLDDVKWLSWDERVEFGFLWLF